MTGQIPVHVLSGFLGSGKTTLLNRIIRQDMFAGSAVIINEFGEIGLDHHLVEKTDGTIIELSNGCLCCTVRGQLVETLEDLILRKPDRIMIETTGLADPGPVLQAIIATPSIRDVVRFAGLYTVFDTQGGKDTLQDQREARLQLQLADHIILSKLDRSSNPDDTQSKATLLLRTINPDCRISTADEFVANTDEAFSNPHSHSCSHSRPGVDPHHDHTHHHHDVMVHSDRIAAITLSHDVAIEHQQLVMFLDLLLSAHGAHILRLKGLAHIAGEEKPVVVQAVGRALSPLEYLSKWPDSDRHTRLIVFVEGMDPQFVKQLFNGFMNIPAPDTPDRQALEDNPLAIAGISDGKFR